MKRDFWLILLLFLALLAGMLLTAFLGRGSRHGYGTVRHPGPALSTLQGPSGDPMFKMPENS